MSWETQIVLNLISSGVLTQWPLAYTSFLAYETLLGPMIKLHPLQPSSVFNDTGKYNHSPCAVPFLIALAPAAGPWTMYM